MISALKILTRISYPNQQGHFIDAVFARFINDINSELYISYLTDHKPIISKIDLQHVTSNEIIDSSIINSNRNEEST